MAIGIVFLYLGILAYGLLLLPFICLAVYAWTHFRRSTAFVYLGLVAWLFSAPIVSVVVLVAQDASGLSFGHPLLVGCATSSPLFLVPLARALLAPSKPLGRRIQPA